MSLVEPVESPIRIMRVIARLNVGGPALHVTYLSRDLDKLGYRTRLITGTVGPDEASMDAFAVEEGLYPVHIANLQRELNPIRDLMALLRVRQQIRRFRPTIVHTHTAKAGAIGRAAAMIAGGARPALVVHTFHGHVLRGYFSPARTRVFLALERLFARHSDVLVAVSPEVRDDLVSLGVAPEERFEIVRLGIDLDARTTPSAGAGAHIRAELGIAPEAFLVGWFGRMTEIKRPDVLIDVFARVSPEEPGAHLVLVGDGPLRVEVEERAALHGVAARTSFVGYRDDVAGYLDAADVVILTSINEGTPVSLIEASAAGRPVVSTDVGGVRDVVVDGETGLLAPSGAVDELAAHTIRLARDPELRERLGQAGAEYVRARYSVERLVGDMDDLYRRRLALRPAKPNARAIAEPLRPTVRAPQTPRPPGSLRVVIFSQYFPPEIGATQSRMQSFADYLSQRGHEVTVVCEMPNHPQGVIPERYRGLLYADDRSNLYRVLRVRVKASEEKTPRTRTAFYLSYMAMATAVTPLVGRADVVLATTPPLFSGAAGLAVSRLLRAPLVLDVRDLWPAAAVSLRQMGAGRALRLAEWLERRLYRDAAVVTAVTRPFCEHIDRIRRRPPETVLLPNGTLDLFLDDVDAAPREELGARDGSFLVTFAGTHGIAQALPSVLDAAAKLDGDVELALVGDGPMKHILLDQARRLGLENVHFRDQVPLEQMPRLLKASDALLVPLAAHPTFQSFVPSKLIDFMAVGRPVVVAAAGEARRILEVSGAGVGVDPEDPDALAETLRSLAGDRTRLASYAERGREFARTRTRLRQAERLEHVLWSVVSGR